MDEDDNGMNSGEKEYELDRQHGIYSDESW